MSKLAKVLFAPVQLIGGKLGKILQATAFIGAGIISGNPGLILAGLTQLAAALQKMKARVGEASAVQIGEVARSGIFGKTAVAGSLVDAYNYGGKYKTDWTVLVVALADHRCDGLVGFYVNDAYVAYGGDGMVPGYRDKLQVFFRPGTWDQDVPSILTTWAPSFPAGHPQAGQPTWTAADRGRSVAYVVVAYKADKPDEKKPVWSAGRPQFMWVVKGLRCYSARKDSTVGGSGAHRWDDPATREWSDNLADCRYTWARGIYAGDKVGQPEMLLLGRGLTVDEAPPANVFAPANLCDEPVALKAGGTEPRYRCSGTFQASEPFIDIEERFAAACGGIVVEREGSVELEPAAAKSPAWVITDDDLIVSTSVSRRDVPMRTDEDWVNSVSPRYIEPTKKYKDHSAPLRRVTGDVITDKGPRVATPALDYVFSGTQAQRLGEMIRRLGRLWRRRTLTLGPRFAGIEHGDWLLWNSERYGVLLARVMSDALAADWRNTITLREISASYADWNAAVDELDDKSVTVNSPTPGDIGAPGAGSWTLTATTKTGDTTTAEVLVFAGAVDDEYAQAVIFEYAAASVAPDPNNDAAWTIAAMSPPTTTRAEAVALSGTTYFGAVSYRVDGEPGDRLVLGPVTTAASAALVTDTGETLTTGSGELLLAA